MSSIIFPTGDISGGIGGGRFLLLPSAEFFLLPSSAEFLSLASSLPLSAVSVLKLVVYCITFSFGGGRGGGKEGASVLDASICCFLGGDGKGG